MNKLIACLVLFVGGSSGVWMPTNINPFGVISLPFAFVMGMLAAELWFRGRQ